MIINIKTVIKKIPILRKIISENDNLRLEIEKLQKELADTNRFVPPGHFYSPIPSITEVQRREDSVFGNISSELLGINLYKQDQICLFEKFVPFYKELPFKAEEQKNLRYYFQNPAYSYSDAIILYCMIRHLKPKRMIEIGSGFSSCVMLDTNEFYFDGSIKTTFIEPYPDLLMSLISEEDKKKVNIIPKCLQDVEFSVFQELRANDVLFIDSTHVSKINSDVNRIFFDILPRLASGVYIHFHDIFYPFEYPKNWIYAGIAWNEAYILRAFLQYNDDFRVVFMNTYMEHFFEDMFDKKMPLCLKNKGGSIWIRKN